MAILVVNAGSSSVKFGLFRFTDLESLARGTLDWAGDDRRATLHLDMPGGEPIHRPIDAPDYRTGVAAGLCALEKLWAGDPAGIAIRVVGHRLIHGGEKIRQPVRIDAAMKEMIRSSAHLAPLHIPPGLEAIEAVELAFPGVPQVGLFDTAFFSQIPPAAYLYPVPYDWYTQWGIRRYGFHGTSHAYCTERATAMLGGEARRLVICHLGQGGSATAVRDGVAVTNTMGFTPLEGFMMGTRSGTVDPGILIHVLREHGLTVDELDRVLHKKSGLLGLSGISSDFRQVEQAAAGGHEQAQLALDVYAYRVRAMIGALAVNIGGLDGLVFTGGIGENSRWLRGEVCRGLECLGVELDAGKNAACRPDADIAAAGSPARVLVIHTREDYYIARQARRLVCEEAVP